MSDRRAFLGTLALGAAQVVKLALQFAVLPVLARILGPSSYGLVALAMPFILFANMISDAGLGNALVRSAQPSRALQSTVFWLSLLICIGLAAILALSAWPIGRFMGEPRVAPILWALCPILIVSGSLSVANATIMRERRFSVFALSDTVSSVVAAVVAIGAALRGFGAWSLVIQQLVLWLIKATWVQWAARFVPSFECKLALARPHLAFGINGAASNIADFVSKNAPQLIVGAFLGVVAVGHYSMGWQLTRVPDAIISGPIYLSVFTAVARLGDNPAAILTLATRGLRAVAVGLAPIFAGLGLVADLAVQLLLGNKWLAATPVLMWLCPAGFLLCFYSIISAVMMGIGRSGLQLRLTVLSGLTMGGGAFVGAHFSDVGVAIGMSIGAVIIAPAYIVTLANAMGAKSVPLAMQFAPPLAATAVMTLCVILVRNLVGGWAPAGQFAAAVAAGIVSYAAVLLTLSGRTMIEDLRMVLPRRAVAQPEPS